MLSSCTSPDCFSIKCVAQSLYLQERLQLEHTKDTSVIEGSMRALRFNAADGIKLVEQDVPKPGPDQALIRVLRAGICNTDIEITKGYVPGYDSIMGHEFVGRVEACESAPEWVGKTVCGEINFLGKEASSKCGPKKDDFTRNHFPDRTVFGIIFQDGCFADYTVVPVSNLFEVPDGVPLEHATFVEPLAAACRIGEQGLFKPTDRVAVVGDGKLGLLIAQTIIMQGVDRLTLFGRHSEKMQLVQGATRVLATPGVEEMYAKAFDVVVDATGSSTGIAFSLAITRPMGTVVQKSTCAGGQPLSVSLINTLVVDEIRLVGSRCGPFDVAMSMLKEPALVKLLNGLIISRYSLSDGLAAITKAKTKGVLKVILDMEQTA